MKNTALDAVALTLSIIGAVNWGLIGLFKFDLVAFLFGSMTLLSRIIYTICLLYTSPSPRDVEESRMPSSA